MIIGAEKICGLQAGNPETLAVWFHSKSKGLRTKRTDGINSSLSQKPENEECQWCESHSELQKPIFPLK